MKYELREGITLSSKERHKELKKAVEYLLKTFPPQQKPIKFLSFTFYKGDGVNPAANGDYTGAEGFPHHDCQIRVSYGKNGLDKKALNYLFHEYKHFLQDDAGYLNDPKHKITKFCCTEANEWAEEQLAIYRKSLEEDKLTVKLIIKERPVYLTQNQAKELYGQLTEVLRLSEQ